MFPICADAQYKDKKAQEEAPKTEAQLIMEQADSSVTPVVITLDQALKIALSENVSVKVADLEIKRTEYAKKGATQLFIHRLTLLDHTRELLRSRLCI